MLRTVRGARLQCEFLQSHSKSDFLDSRCPIVQETKESGISFIWEK